MSNKRIRNLNDVSGNLDNTKYIVDDTITTYNTTYETLYANLNDFIFSEYKPTFDLNDSISIKRFNDLTIQKIEDDIFISGSSIPQTDDYKCNIIMDLSKNYSIQYDITYDILNSVNDRRTITFNFKQETLPRVAPPQSPTSGILGQYFAYNDYIDNTLQINSGIEKTKDDIYMCTGFNQTRAISMVFDNTQMPFTPILNTTLVSDGITEELYFSLLLDITTLPALPLGYDLDLRMKAIIKIHEY